MRYCFSAAAAVIVSIFMLGGCSTTSAPAGEAAMSAKSDMQQESAWVELYEVHQDGRIYLFYDRALYQDFLATGHTAYHFTRISDGPKGETLVFALTGEDKKKLSGIPSVDLYDEQVTPEKFYGETYLDGRVYVFDSLDEMAAVRAHHEAAYRLTDIGAGPNGETVVYVLTSENKTERPEALMARYKQKNAKSP